MTESQNTEPNNDMAFSRRDVLKTIGVAGVIGSFGAETAAAKEQKRMIVGTRPGRADVARKKANQVINTLDFDDIGQAVVGRWPEQALKGLEHNPNVRYVEEDRVVSIEGHPGEDEDFDWSNDRLDVEAAHANGHMGDGISVAIIDTGIDSRHDDLVDNLHDSLHTATAPCSGGDCPEDWHDDHGHGTGVAGIVGAVHTDSDVIGVAPEVTLHAVKVTPDDGDGFASNLAAGLEWVADNGMDVANMSLGVDDPNDCVRDAMQCARDNDVVLVSSAGNEGGGPVTFPGGYDQDIAVSGITELDELSTVSSTGPEVDIAAPTRSGTGQTGRGILTTQLNGGTMRFGGTSAAAPHVTAAAALMLEAGTTDDDVETELENTAEDLGLDAEEQGAGLVDVANSLGFDSANDLLEVETDPADSEDFTEARLNGELTHLIGSDSAEVFFQYREAGTGSWTTTPTETKTGAVPFNSSVSFDRTVTGLEEDTTYEFRAVATNAEGSTERGAIETFSTVDNQDPSAAITHSPPEPNPDQTVTFDGSGSGDGDGAGDSIVSYEWDLDNDGSFDDATGVTASQSYATGGNKTVRLRVKDEFDQTDTATHTFYVNKAPTASFTVSPDPVVRNETATFDASGSSDPDGSVDRYEWDWDNDGTFDESTTSATTTHTFTTGGEHTVALRVTDDDGATSEVVTMTFTVHIRVAIDIKPNGTGPNPINLKSRGQIPVAVLHTSAFDPPARLDPSTVRFGDPDDVSFDASHTPQGGATPAHMSGHVKDVDRDGDMDSLFHFPTQDADFDSADSEGELVGLTKNGVPVFGTDNVKIVDGGGP